QGCRCPGADTPGDVERSLTACCRRAHGQREFRSRCSLTVEAASVGGDGAADSGLPEEGRKFPRIDPLDSQVIDEASLQSLQPIGEVSFLRQRGAMWLRNWQRYHTLPRSRGF